MTVFEKVKYRLEGECNKCGDCCHFLYCTQNMSKLEFFFIKLFQPEYRRFRIIGRDEFGPVLACKLIRPDGLCPDYEKRPAICRNFPHPEKVQAGGKLYARCSYRLIPEKNFGEYLSSEKL